jgi:hypothetical protein
MGGTFDPVGEPDTLNELGQFLRPANLRQIFSAASAAILSYRL